MEKILFWKGNFRAYSFCNITFCTPNSFSLPCYNCWKEKKWIRHANIYPRKANKHFLPQGNKIRYRYWTAAHHWMPKIKFPITNTQCCSYAAAVHSLQSMHSMMEQQNFIKFVFHFWLKFLNIIKKLQLSKKTLVLYQISLQLYLIFLR